MPDDSAASRERTAQRLAPRWHTTGLIAVMVAVASTGAALSLLHRGAPRPVPAGSRIVDVYLPMLVVEWGLVLYVCRIGRPRSALGPLLGEGRFTVARVFADLGVAVAGFVLIEGFAFASAALVGTSAHAAMTALLPVGTAERLAWVFVATSVGFSEEVVYRGYLQTQLAAFTRSPAIAIASQAVLFGMAHAEQGVGAATRMVIYGAGFGLVATWRRSLLPGIACHVAIDLFSGFVAGR
ncbi:MAG TPA: CPBP family intramembrane glutamic endopeptidase [Polyangiaceae bacterium]|nr:CPBP family intramembrane glutamic endopeptidase [Polyangiaceae bacterium]